MNGELPTEEEVQRQTPKVEPEAEDIPKEEPGAGPPPERTEPRDRSEELARLGTELLGVGEVAGVVVRDLERNGLSCGNGLEIGEQL